MSQGFLYASKTAFWSASRAYPTRGTTRSTRQVERTNLRKLCINNRRIETRKCGRGYFRSIKFSASLFPLVHQQQIIRNHGQTRRTNHIVSCACPELG